MRASFASLVVIATIAGCSSSPTPTTTQLTVDADPIIRPIAPCSQVAVTLHPHPTTPANIPITVSLQAPPAGVYAAPLRTSSSVASVDFVITLGPALVSYHLTAIAESPGYLPVEIPIALTVLCRADDLDCGLCSVPGAKSPLVIGDPLRPSSVGEKGHEPAEGIRA